MPSKQDRCILGQARVCLTPSLPCYLSVKQSVVCRSRVLRFSCSAFEHVPLLTVPEGLRNCPGSTHPGQTVAPGASGICHHVSARTDQMLGTENSHGQRRPRQRVHGGRSSPLPRSMRSRNIARCVLEARRCHTARLRSRYGDPRACSGQRRCPVPSGADRRRCAASASR